MTKGIINKIIKFSSVDGPGNRTTIFLQQCNFNCFYCHNPETINSCVHCGICVSHCPVSALYIQDNKVCWDENKCIDCDKCIKICPHTSSPKIKFLSALEVFNEIGVNTLPFISGITVSGGECTLQRDFLIELFTLAKEKNLTTYIDTNGTYDFSIDLELLAVTDFVMLDVKAFSSSEHMNFTDNPNDVVLKNLLFLCKTSKLYEVRTVAVEGLFDVESTIFNVSKIISKFPDVRYKIIAYRPFGVRDICKNYKTPSDDYMLKLADISEKCGVLDVVII